MNKLMNSSMFGLAPIAPSQTLVCNDEERPGVENDEISPPVIERMATREEIARIRVNVIPSSWWGRPATQIAPRKGRSRIAERFPIQTSARVAITSKPPAHNQ
jgi:hypothetical protein